MLPTLYKAVCTRLLQADFTERINLCCLCLETVGESGASVEDEVVLNLPGRSYHCLKLANILKFLLDEDFSEVMFILKSVCKQCISSAIAGYKFIQCCKENAKKLTRVIENFENSLDDMIPDDKINCKSIYVALQPSNHYNKTCIKRYYDIRRQFIPEDTAFLRFTQIIESQKQLPEEIQDHVEEVEQKININEKEWELEALMCCKTFLDTKELLDDLNKPHDFRCKICKEQFAKSTSLRVHFFRVHRQKGFKCVKCKTAEDTQPNIVKQKQPTVIVNILKNTDLIGCAEKNYPFTKDPLQSEESDVQLLCEDNEDHLQEQDSIENEEQNQNTITIVPTESYLQDSSHHNVQLMSFGAKKQYIVERKIETENCCKNCGMKFSTRFRYLSHKKKYESNNCRRHKGRGEFKCDLCNYTAFYKAPLRNHIRYEHLGEKGYVCSYCNKNCYSNSRLKTHLVKHTGERSFHCDECKGRFASKGSLKHHKYIHTGERPFKCEFCDKTFRTGTNLGGHIKSLHKPP